MTITRKNLAEVVKYSIGVSDEDADKAVVSIIEFIKSEVAKGSKVEIRGFGSLFPFLSKRVKVRHIAKGEDMLIEPTLKPKFRPSREFVKLCNKK